MHYMIVSGHFEHVEVFAYLNIFGGLEIFNKEKKIFQFYEPRVRDKE